MPQPILPEGVSPTPTLREGSTHLHAFHPHHGSVDYWIDPEVFQEVVVGLMRPLWINGYVMVFHT